MKPIRILIADDHSLMRMGLVSLFRTERDLDVVGEAENGRTAVRLAKSLRPDVVIMDLLMPVLSGAEATRLIRESVPDARVLILTSYGSSQELVDAINNGADGALNKDTSADNLIASVRKIARGEKIIPEFLSQRLDEERETSRLTDRQLDILHSVARGLTDREIATQFNISLSGTKHHLRRILTKIGAANRAEAAVIALRKQLLKI